MRDNKTSSISSSRGKPKKSESLIPGKNRYSIGGTIFEIDEKYVPIKLIGKGAYGIVISAQDSQKDSIVAIKRINDTFLTRVDAMRTLREISLLKNLDHENIVKIKDILMPASKEKLTDVYVVYECMDTDMHQVIRSPQTLTEVHCQFFIWQLLNGLKYLHSLNIIHRDLKPSNLLINTDCDLKICDFGLARLTKNGGEREDMTQYVVTRYYRAPELFISSHYSTAIDMWSVGCILAELLLRKPIFQENKKMALLKILDVVGIPHKDDVQFVNYPMIRDFLKSQVNPNAGLNLKKMFSGCCSEEALDLLEKLLKFNPEKRLTAEEALRHPWLSDYNNNDSPTSTSTTTSTSTSTSTSTTNTANMPHPHNNKMKFEFDDTMTMSEIHDLVFKECQYWQGKRQQQQQQ